MKDENPLPILREFVTSAYETARRLGTAFTMEEISQYFIPWTTVTSEELADYVTSDPVLKSQFEVRDGFLVEKEGDDMRERRREQIRISKRKKRVSERPAELIDKLSPSTRLIAITGSTAYDSADSWEDVDLFLLTREKRLWITMLLSLLLLRFLRIIGSKSSAHSLNVSFALDEGELRRRCRKSPSLLLARELLAIDVLVGEGTYGRVLGRNPWLGRILPKAYRERLSEVDVGRSGGRYEEEESSLARWLGDAVDTLSFGFLRLYLNVKAKVHNAILRREGKYEDVFETSLSRSSCVFTSRRYERLEKVWGRGGIVGDVASAEKSREIDPLIGSG